MMYKLLLGTVLLALASPVFAQGSPTCGGVFPAAADATIDREWPTTPRGEEGTLEVSGFAAGTGERSVLLHFNLDGAIPPGSTINRVTLELPGILSGAGEITFAIYPLEEDPWEEWWVTWYARPRAVNNGVRRSIQYDTVAGIDLTDLVTEWATGSLPTADFELAATNFYEEIILRSWETGEGPRLHVSCSAPAPQLTAPAGEADAVQQQAMNSLREDSSRPVHFKIEGGALVTAEMGIATPVSMAGDSLARADWFLGQYSGLLRGASPTSDLQLSRRSPEGLHLFYRQRHAGVPVFPGELAVHLSQDEVVALTGRYTLRIDLDNIPRLGADHAETLAKAAAGDGAVTAGTAQLNYLDLRTMKSGDEQVHLAWQITVPKGATPGTYYVDAYNGQVLLVMALSQDAFDLAVNTGSGAPPAGGLYNGCWWPTGADIQWFTESGVIPGQSPDTDGFRAFNNATTVDSFWRTTFGRDGHMGIGGLEGHYVHVTFPFGPGAHFDPGCNIFEYDNGVLGPDIVGHEFTHGVIYNTSGLNYKDEPGALNESYADLFGYMVDPNNFTMGETSSLGTLRTLNNPPVACPATPLECDKLPPDNCGPDHVMASVSGDGCGKRPGGAGATDHGWVHINSSINNKAGALIIAGGMHNGIAVTGMGRAKAARLFHAAITKWLGRNSQLIDARDVSVAEASNNPSFSRSDVCTVKNAYASVGLGSGDIDCDGIDDLSETDPDNDGVPDGSDNCPVTVNPGQEDRDQDGAGDACDPDQDGDGIPNATDNCPVTGNPAQADWNSNGIGDACDDSDGDLSLDSNDNCRTVVNKDQIDSDGDLIGDACDPDSDNDDLLNGIDNCPGTYNPSNEDADGDGAGDLCDNCTRVAGVNPNDWGDADNDGRGNVCDQDDDGDGVPDTTDNCPTVYNPSQVDFDFSGRGTRCDVFETRALYEYPNFWDSGRFIKWDLPDMPLEIPLPICPGCPGPFLPHGFTQVLTLQSDVNVNLRIVDRAGMTRASDYTFGPGHQLAFQPTAFAKSVFDYGDFLGGGTHGPLPGDISRVVKPDQEAYSLLVYPQPGTDITSYHSLQMVVHPCADVDGDGAYTGDSTCLTLGAADCNDSDAAIFPGNPETCDGKDNNCDGTVDSFATQCGVGSCASYGFCAGGFDTCQPGAVTPEVCDGLDNNCDGVVDNGPTPSAAIDVILSGSQILWSALPNTAMWDIAYGSLGLLPATQGDFSVATAGCLAHRTPTPEVVASLTPAAGEGFWVLVRGYNCTGAGSYDDGLAGSQVQSRDAEMNNSPNGCQDCAHSVYAVGVALTPTCESCAGYVCNQDPYCCNVFWDSICVAEAGSCPHCAHSLCEVGAALTPTCEPCAGYVCRIDPYCCNVSWDSICVAEANSGCSLGCF